MNHYLHLHTKLVHSQTSAYSNKTMTSTVLIVFIYLAIPFNWTIIIVNIKRQVLIKIACCNLEYHQLQHRYQHWHLYFSHSGWHIIRLCKVSPAEIMKQPTYTI